MTKFCYFCSAKTASIVKCSFLILMVWIYSGPSYSDPPSPPSNTAWFYRVDTRPPEIIFSEGFAPRGNDHDLVSQFLGYSEQLTNNGFVSVTDSFSVAVEFADSILRSGDNDNLYIYRVNAAAGFYNVEYSIRTHVDNILSDREESGDSLHNYLERIYDGLDAFSWEREWVTSNTIAGSSVRAASLVRRSPHLNSAYPGLHISVDEESVPNPEFIASNSLGYQSVYTIPIPDEDIVSSDSDHSTHNDDSDDNQNHSSDSMAVPTYSGYISISIIYPDCIDPGNQKKRSTQNAFSEKDCPLAINLTKMRRDSVYISTILSDTY